MPANTTTAIPTILQAILTKVFVFFFNLNCLQSISPKTSHINKPRRALMIIVVISISFEPLLTLLAVLNNFPIFEITF